MSVEYKSPTHANEIPHRDRLADIQVPHLIRAAQEALGEFSGAVDDTPTDATVDGICVVGSTLTDSFTPGVSDCDVYFLLSQSYDNSKDFCRMLNDGRSACRAWVNDGLGDIFSGVDALGALGPDESSRFIEPPAAYLYPGDET